MNRTSSPRKSRLRPACACCSPTGRPADACGERRLLLGLAALASLGGLAACGERQSATPQAGGPAAAEFTTATACELDGMLLADYGGPKAQIHYGGATAPVFLCDTVELFNMLLRPEQVRQVLAAYVQDMGRADWDQPRGFWIDARTALYVRGSKRMGSMGPTLASFANEADAKKFIEQYGGTLLRHAEIQPDMVDLSGGAKHDTRM